METPGYSHVADLVKSEVMVRSAVPTAVDISRTVYNTLRPHINSAKGPTLSSFRWAV